MHHPLKNDENHLENGMREDLLIKNIAGDSPSNQSYDDRQRHRGRWGGERDTGDENDSFKSFTKNGDERDYEHTILLAPLLKSYLPAKSNDRSIFKRFGNLDTPLLLHLSNTKKSSTHDSYHQGGEKGKGRFPVVLGVLPFVFTQAIKSPDQSTANDQTDQKTSASAKPDLEQHQTACFGHEVESRINPTCFTSFL